MQFMPGSLTRAQSDAFAQKAQAQPLERGFGLWAVQVRAQTPFIDSVGLSPVSFAAPFTPAVEIAWRLERARWGHGYATEAAREVLRFAFEDLGLHEVVAFTVPANLGSRGLMQRLGFRYDAHGDFEHPRLPLGHALRAHLLCRLSSGAWAPWRA
jgi:RimJ/RimL family protein N-acetyltransferase